VVSENWLQNPGIQYQDRAGAERIEAPWLILFASALVLIRRLYLQVVAAIAAVHLRYS
jgi:hypothetical protein